ncbi:Sperm-tail PG-rich repeat-containing protein 2 [Cichlidogyrus casuarinus]|uniref:Sperm-tail PG-rich repeat-containing protein 2 n=1 Tax=Cichlidogyrus casuarinus TaxID=1844966 RepID=A0ABD2QKR5_9PLAT
MKDMAYESFKKAAFTSFGNPKKGFGSTALRNIGEVSKEKAKLPAPNNYNLTDQMTEKTRVKACQLPLTANFASRTIRMRELHREDGNPDATSYNVTESFDFISRQGARRHPPLNKEASKRQSCFLSNSNRGALYSRACLDNPGPGQYEARDCSNNKGKIASRSDRNVCQLQLHEVTPGPAHYALAPEVADSVLKSTFNATLTNPFTVIRAERQRGEEKPMLVRVHI